MIRTALLAALLGFASPALAGLDVAPLQIDPTIYAKTTDLTAATTGIVKKVGGTSPDGTGNVALPTTFSGTSCTDCGMLRPVFSGAMRISKQEVAPATGATVVSDGSQLLAVLNAVGIVTLTVTFPASPADGQIFQITSRSAITTLSLSGNGNSIINPLTTLAIGGWGTWTYSSSAGLWMRTG